MPYFHFKQNNSGGGFDFDEATGITHHVVIEASSADEADDRAESIGLYFDGVDSGRDCECCGDRWSRAWRDDGSPEPMVYSHKANNYKGPFGGGWMPLGKEIAVHHLDDRVEWFGVVTERHKP